MRERDYPIYGLFHHPSDSDSYFPIPNPVLPPSEWTKRLAEMDQAQAADVEHAIQDAANFHSDVHLYRKRGSLFLGIGFEPASGSSVRVFEYPEILS